MIRSTPALFNALAAIPVLAGTNLAAQTLLAKEGLVRNFPADTWIVCERDEGHSFFILVEGDVDIIKHANTSNAVILATLHRSSIFGEMSIVDPVPRAASVRTRTPVQVIEIKAATLHHLSQNLPDQYAIVLLNLARGMARRLRDVDEAFAACV